MNQNSKTLWAIYLNQGFTVLFGLVMVPFYIKSLGIASYGYIALFSLFGIVVSNLDFGLFSTINKTLATPNRNTSHLASIIGFIEGIICLLLFVAILSFVISRIWFTTSDLQTYFLILLWGLLKILDNLYRQSLFGLQKQKTHSQISILLTLLRGILIYGFIVYYKAVFDSYILALTISLAMGVVIFRLLVERDISQKINIDTRQWNSDFLGLAKKFFLINILGQILLQLDKILVFMFSLDMDGFGYYALGLTVAGIVLTAAAPLQQLLFSRIPSKDLHEGIIDSFKYFNNWYRVTTLILMLSTAIFPLVMPYLLPFWLGEIANSYDLFYSIYLVFLAYFFLTLMNLNIIYFQVKLNPDIANRILVVGIILYLIISIFAFVLDIYDPVLCLFIAFFGAYSYSRYVLVRKMKFLNTPPIQLRLEIFTVIFVFFTLILAGMLKDDFNMAGPAGLSTWNGIFVVVSIMSGLVGYSYYRNNLSEEW